MSMLLVLSVQVKAVDMKVGVANGFVLPFGVQLTNEFFSDITLKHTLQIGNEEVVVKFWHGQSSDYDETDYIITYKDITISYFDIPGDSDIVFTAYKDPNTDIVFKALKPKGKTVGLQATKTFEIKEGVCATLTAGTAPFSGDYLITPSVKMVSHFDKHMGISLDAKYPMGEVLKSKKFDPSLTIRFWYYF